MKRSRMFVSISALACLLQTFACASNTDESSGVDESNRYAEPNQAAAAPQTDSVEASEIVDESESAPAAVARGFGTITGRRPATNTVVPGIRLRAHDVRVTIRDGFARTEIEEEFANDTDMVLEGRYVFPLPSGASLSKLGLWVENELVLGEMVEKDRAARIFQGIVDDVVRPRDPALLEWKSGSSFSLKIFPMPAHQSRKVLIAYDEVLPIVNGRVRYTYPLSLGPDRAVKMDAFRLHVAIEDLGAQAAEAKITGHAASLRTEEGRLYADFSANAFVPEGDFLMDYPRPTSESAPVAIEGSASDGFFSVRIPVPTPADQSSVISRNEKVIVLDTSHGMTEAGYATEVAVAKEILRQMDSEDRFAILLCDSACVAYPERGLSQYSVGTVAEAQRFLVEHTVSGASDISFALTRALERLGETRRGQVVYLGDGTPSAGEMKVETIAARVQPLLSEKRAELRFIGAGPSIDEVVFMGLAENLSASYERFASGDRMGKRARDIAKSLAKPLLIGAKLELPAGFVDVVPSVLPALRAGEEIVVVGKLAGATGSEGETIRLSGEMDGQAATWSRKLATSRAPTANQNMLARRWATARIEQLERRHDDEATKEIIAQSIKHHVMSRHTSLIVLENDRMFAAFGIPRTQGNGQLSSAAQVGGAPLFGNSIGDSFGAGGLGLSGIGEGGGGKGFGTGIGTGQGFGSGHGRLSGTHKTSSPSVRMGATTVSGRLPPEIIQRIVRQNFGRFRLCYENGLRNNPNLQGRVGVRFIIGRDGNVTSASNGGSDLPDAGVISCVTRAFYGLSFPQPEGGVVSVVYPIMFASEGGGGGGTWSGPRLSRGFTSPQQVWGRTSWIGAADEKWRTEFADQLVNLQKNVDGSKDSRRAREAFVNGLLLRGRFEEAFREASAYVTMDPDRVMPHELLARAASALGKSEMAVAELDTQVDIEPTNADMHKRAARSFEAAGDEIRACAHWRSLAELRANDQDAAFEALRCRSRALGEKNAVLAQLNALPNLSKRMTTLRTALENGSVPTYEAGKPAGETMSVAITCPEGTEGCPRIVIVDPTGRVTTPVTPGTGRSGSSWITMPSPMDGTYHVLVSGGLDSAGGKVEIHLNDSVKKFDVRGGNGLRSVAVMSASGF
ncbi:MAG TPA: AgmX/PglI C-terminal domain-containing protein [Polyangium sp.]|nr:AgmX/PglI C-terminal domain-containing protein [Polyangium sp.]